MSSTQNFQTNVTAELAALRAENAEMKIMLKEILAQPPQSAPAATKKTKKTKAEPSGEPKEKKAPSAWIVFSSQQVQKLIRAAEEGMDKSEKSKVGTVNQFAGQLWSQRHEWSDEEITAAWAEFTPPEVSKQEAAGKSKRSGSSTGSAAAAEPVADAPDAGEKKARKPQSEETKKAAAVKRAATKAAKAAAAPEAEEAEQPADEPAPAPVVAEKPKAKAKITAKPKKVVDLALDAWSHDGTEYLKNERNDVLTTDGEWVGVWDGKTINTAAPEPADFESLTTRD
jgi:hypothetical protein